MSTTSNTWCPKHTTRRPQVLGSIKGSCGEEGIRVSTIAAALTKTLDISCIIGDEILPSYIVIT